jgi:acetyl-CoA carboxylase carboxyltransferase component
MSSNRETWTELLAELSSRRAFAAQMGGEERVARQHARGRLTARERIAALCDRDSFSEIGELAGGEHPGGGEAVAADALVGGTARVDGRSVVVLAEDFTVKGGSIGHPNNAKRTRLVTLAGEQRLPIVLMLDGAGERATNALERYPFAPGDLQLFADIRGQVPVVTLVLGTSAGHGALTGMFADLIVMLADAALFTAGPPLVEAALGIRATPEEIGGAPMHTRDSGVAHNLAASEAEAFAMTRRFLSYMPEPHPRQAPERAAPDSSVERRRLDSLLDLIPPDSRAAYDVRRVLEEVVDTGTVFELQPDFGRSMVCALARIGGTPCMIVGNQPAVLAGAITREAAEKSTHFIDVAGAFELPLVFLLDNPGVMPGPAAEKSGVLRAAAGMFAAQRRYRGTKIVVTLRKAYGFGSSVMGMNPFDRQAISLALPSVSLGGVPAIGGAAAAKSSAEDARRMQTVQSGAWVPADAMAFDKVIDPRELRNEIISVLRRRLPQAR